MGRVLKRIQGYQLKSEILKIKNKEVDIVLINNSVIHGIIFSVSKTELQLLNIIRNKSKIKFKEIKEILFV